MDVFDWGHGEDGEREGGVRVSAEETLWISRQGTDWPGLESRVRAELGE